MILVGIWNTLKRIPSDIAESAAAKVEIRLAPKFDAHVAALNAHIEDDKSIVAELRELIHPRKTRSAHSGD